MPRETRSGTPTTPNAKRTRPMVTLTLSPEALARLDVLAKDRGQSRSGAVEQLIRNARLRETGEGTMTTQAFYRSRQEQRKAARAERRQPEVGQAWSWSARGYGDSSVHFTITAIHGDTFAYRTLNGREGTGLLRTLVKGARGAKLSPLPQKENAQ